MAFEPVQYGGPPDVCAVCQHPFEDNSNVVTERVIDEVWRFCSENCRQQFLKEPDKYAEFENGEEEAED